MTRSARQPVMSSPSKTTRPASGGINPETQLNSVVFPAPLGPMRPVMVPARDVEIGAGQRLDAVEAAAKPRDLEERQAAFATLGTHHVSARLAFGCGSPIHCYLRVAPWKSSHWSARGVQTRRSRVA